MLFDERYHLHVGYYENSKDIEAILLKVKDENIWCMFIENDYYQLKISKKDYPSLDTFGLLIGIFNESTGEMSFEKGSELLKTFLRNENLI